jgi:hypothetical protein
LKEDGNGFSEDSDLSNARLNFAYGIPNRLEGGKTKAET